MILLLAHRRGAPPPRLLPLLAAVAVLLAALAAPAVAQAPSDGELVVHVYKLEHQPAGEAWALLQPLLSARGSVELRPADNTLVLRDSTAAMDRILPVLTAFDHPPRDVDVEVWLIRASDKAAVSPPMLRDRSNVPKDLLANLAARLPYQHYDLVAQSRVRSREGQRITFQLGPDHSVRFRLGTILGDQRLRLVDFEVFQEERGSTAEKLAKGNLNLWLGRNMVFALTQGESSPTALMVVVRCRQSAPARAGRR